MADDLGSLLSIIRSHPNADFYRARWGSSSAFEELPTVSSDEFAQAPLHSRLYKNEKGIVKIVRRGRGAFLSAWSFEDIASEPLDISFSRPMVYMQDAHEALVTALLCYERERMPLLVGGDVELAGLYARKAQVNGLLTDAVSAEKLLPLLEDLSLENVVVFGDRPDSFRVPFLSSYGERVRFVLTLPETGMLAEAVSAERPVFRSFKGCILEHDGEVVATKTHLLSTPIIRYRTGIASLPLSDGSGFILL